MRLLYAKSNETASRRRQAAPASPRRRAGCGQSRPRQTLRLLAFLDGYFDIVTVFFGLHELPHDVMVRVLREAARVTKPGGKLLAVDFEKEGPPLRRALLAAFLRIVEPHHVTDFLKLDWSTLLPPLGWRLEGIRTLFCSKLISATRASIS